jgi:hypothetical protein
MQDYLPDHEGEVIQMLTTEWNIDDALRVRAEEGKKEGKEEDARKMKAKGYPSADITEITGIPPEKIEKL